MDYWELDTSNAAAGPFFGSYTGQELADLHVASCVRDLSNLEQRMQKAGLSLSDPNVYVFSDDHCMGSRSKNWGSYPESQKNRLVDTFRSVFDLTTKGLPADRAGAYYSVSKSVELDSYVSKTVKMIFLDNLYDLDERIPITFSPEQLTWFESELSSAASNKDDFILIGNGSPILNAVGDVLVGEKNLIITLVAKYKLENVCFMCGDLHWSEVSYFDKGWVPMMEFVSSGLIHKDKGSYQSYDLDFFADTVSVVHHQLDNTVPSLTSSVFTQIPLSTLRAKNYTNSMIVNGININYLVSKEEMDAKLPFLMNGTIHINSLGYHPSDMASVQYELNGSWVDITVTNKFGYTGCDIYSIAPQLLQALTAADPSNINPDLKISLTTGQEVVISNTLNIGFTTVKVTSLIDINSVIPSSLYSALQQIEDNTHSSIEQHQGLDVSYQLDSGTIITETYWCNGG